MAARSIASAAENSASSQRGKSRTSLVGVVAFRQAVQQHQGKQQGVPVARFQDPQAMAGEQRARLATGEAADIVHAPVMRRQQPAIGRQVEQRDRARPQAAMGLLYGPFGLDPAMAQDIERQVAAQRAIAERHFVDRAGRHRPPDFCSLQGRRQRHRIRGRTSAGRRPPGQAAPACRRCRSLRQAPALCRRPAERPGQFLAASVRRPRYHHMRSSTACMRSYSARSTSFRIARNCRLPLRL